MCKIRFAFVLSAALVSTVLAQAPPSAENKPAAKKADSKSLESLVEESLKNSADVQLAEAKVREAESQRHTAEATLRQIRAQVAQKVIETQRNLEAQRKVFMASDAAYQEMLRFSGKGVGKIELIKYEQEAMTAKAQVVELETRLDILTGQLPGRLFERIAQSTPPRSGQSEPETTKKFPLQGMAERMSKALGQTFKVANDRITIEQLVEQLRTLVPTVPISFAGIDPTTEVKLNFKGELTLAAYFQLITDMTGLNIGVRDYGFIITGVNLPLDAMTVGEFVRNYPK